MRKQSSQTTAAIPTADSVKTDNDRNQSATTSAERFLTDSSQPRSTMSGDLNIAGPSNGSASELSLGISSCQIVFLTADSRDAAEQIQIITMLRPLVDTKFFQLEKGSQLRQIDSQLKKFEQESIDSIWLVTGDNDSLAFELSNNSSVSKDLTWRQALTNNGQLCFLNPIDCQLAERLADLTGLRIQNGIDQTCQIQLDEIIFVDETTENHSQLATHILKTRDAEIVLLDPESCGVSQIKRFLKNRREIKSIHLVCPASPGNLRIGKTLINSKTIEHHHQDNLFEIGQSLCSDAEIRIYNSLFNQGSEGLSTLKSLSSHTGAFVVVSKSHLANGSPEEKTTETHESHLEGKLDVLDVLLKQDNPEHEIELPLALNLAPMKEVELLDENVAAGTEQVDWLKPPTTLFSDSSQAQRYQIDYQLTIGVLCMGLAMGFMAALLTIHLGIL